MAVAAAFFQNPRDSVIMTRCGQATTKSEAAAAERPLRLLCLKCKGSAANPVPPTSSVGLAVSEGDCDVARGIAGFHPHQDGVLLVVVSGLDRVTDLAGIAHILARDFKDDVALLETVRRRRAVGIDVGDNDA